MYICVRVRVEYFNTVVCRYSKSFHGGGGSVEYPKPWGGGGIFQALIVMDRSNSPPPPPPPPPVFHFILGKDFNTLFWQIEHQLAPLTSVKVIYTHPCLYTPCHGGEGVWNTPNLVMGGGSVEYP